MSNEMKKEVHSCATCKFISPENCGHKCEPMGGINQKGIDAWEPQDCLICRAGAWSETGTCVARDWGRCENKSLYYPKRSICVPVPKVEGEDDGKFTEEELWLRDFLCHTVDCENSPNCVTEDGCAISDIYNYFKAKHTSELSAQEERLKGAAIEIIKGVKTFVYSEKEIDEVIEKIKSIKVK